MDSPAYVNHGRWVAECPIPGCGDARALYPQDPVTGIPSPTPVYVQRCASGHEFRLVVPPDEVRARIEAALAERTSEKRKNWFPKDHPYAVEAGFPHGQSVRDLQEETQAGEAADAQALADKRATVLAQVRSLDIPLDDVLAAMKGV